MLKKSHSSFRCILTGKVGEIFYIFNQIMCCYRIIKIGANPWQLVEANLEEGDDPLSSDGYR